MYVYICVHQYVIYMCVSSHMGVHLIASGTMCLVAGTFRYISIRPQRKNAIYSFDRRNNHSIQRAHNGHIEETHYNEILGGFFFFSIEKKF